MSQTEIERAVIDVRALSRAPIHEQLEFLWEVLAIFLITLKYEDVPIKYRHFLK